MPHDAIESRFESSTKTTDNAAATALSNEAMSFSKLNEGNSANKPQDASNLPELSLTDNGKKITGNPDEKKQHQESEKPAEKIHSQESQKQNDFEPTKVEEAAKAGAENKAQSATEEKKPGQAEDSMSSARSGSPENTAESTTTIQKEHASGLSKPWNMHHQSDNVAQGVAIEHASSAAQASHATEVAKVHGARD